ncbi:PKD-like family lipoprotein [Sphingobacterium faecale]|uniref:PKD family protein n=1 Tax=Sphingobacterium faecale TaxID=2803775 RepID=A0ABS1R442_9SPHI|nr:PKD-like family lipoprotein [Sphingobacterium faecale]MBL1409486.1 hypothetical protein [Sphingobacterium faecale]
MKTFIKYSALLMWLFVFGSCKKDLGNYEYTTIDSVFIADIEETYTTKAASTLQIHPKLLLASGKQINTDDYTYRWAAYKIGMNLPPVIIGEENTLDQKVTLDIGSYTIYYTIKEKESEISWTKKFKLQITSGYNGGWMILAEDNGKARIDFFEYDHATGTYPKAHRNFQENIRDAAGNPIGLPGRPKFITTWNNQTEATGKQAKYLVYIGTDQRTEKINLTDGFVWSEQYAFKFETANPPLFETIDAIRPTGSSDGYVVKGNDVYIKNSMFQWNVGTPVNRLSDGKYIKVSPLIATVEGFDMACLMYDMVNKRFIRNSDMSQISTSPLSYNANSSAFNPNDVGMDLVWMNQTVAFGGQAYAVLKKENKFFLARMTNNLTFAARFLDDITGIPDIAKATSFEVDPRYGYLQYVVGGKIYQYDPSEKKTTLMKDYGNRQISTFKYLRSTFINYSTVANVKNEKTYGKRFLPLTLGLVVATFDPTQPQASGKVDVWEAPQFNGAFKSLLSFDGFGKVADVTEAEAPLGW